MMNERPMEKVELITIDAGGTLLFPHPSVGAVYAEVLSRHGRTACPNALEAAFLRVWRREAAILAPEISPEGERQRWREVVCRTFDDIPGPLDLDAIFNDLWEEFGSPARWRLPAGAAETIGVLRERGYRMALLSNWDERLRGLLDGFALASHFDEIFISCELGYEKPDARIFRAVEDHFGLRGEQIAHIGDSRFHDVEGAIAAGWLPIQFQGTAGDGHFRILSFPELLDLLPAKGPSGGRRQKPLRPALPEKHY